MIQKNMEYLYCDNGLEYYLLSEIGFSNKKFAFQQKLYESFGKSSSSTYYEIFTKNLYDNNLIEQIWVFDNNKPVALSMAIHFENFKPLMYQQKNLGEILGQIHLFVKPEYRGKKIASQSSTILEEGFIKYDNGFIVMQDDALRCKKSISHFIPISSNYKENMDQVLKEIFQHQIIKLRKKNINLKANTANQL